MDNLKWTELASKRGTLEESAKPRTLEECFENAKRVIKAETNIKKLDDDALCYLLGFVATRCALVDRREEFSDTKIYDMYSAKLRQRLELLDSHEKSRPKNGNGSYMGLEEIWNTDLKKIDEAVTKIETLIPQWISDKKTGIAQG